MTRQLLCVPCAARTHEEHEGTTPPGSELMRFTAGWSRQRFQCDGCGLVHGACVQAVCFSLGSSLADWEDAYVEIACQSDVHAWEARALLLAIAAGDVALEAGMDGQQCGTYWGYSGDVPFVTAGANGFAGWRLTFFNDCGKLDYLDSCEEPSGRAGEYYRWSDDCGGHDPVSLLPGAAREKLQGLVQTVRPRAGGR